MSDLQKWREDFEAWKAKDREGRGVPDRAIRSPFKRNSLGTYVRLETQRAWDAYRAAMQAQQLRWSSEAPTEAGWYWMRPLPGLGSHAICIELRDFGQGLRLVEQHQAWGHRIPTAMHVLWAGPLEMPPIPAPVGGDDEDQG